MSNIDQLYTVEDHGKGARMPILDQFGKETDMAFIVVGVDSKKWRSLASKANEVEADNDNIEKTAKLLSEAVIGFENIQKDGKDLKHSTKTVYQIFINAPYLLKQVTAFLLNRANFTKG